MAQLLDALASLTDGWEMSFQSVHFLLFLPIVAGAWFVLPQRARRPWLLLASYWFYFFAAPRYLPVLLLGTLFSYVAGRCIGGAKTRAGKSWALGLGVAGLVASLAFFKYSYALLRAVGIPLTSQYYFISTAALGLSFYTFMAIGYLIDAWRGDVPVQKNLITYALFLGFFPAVTSGPISRAGQLMPQLQDTARKFNAGAAADGLKLMAIGFFKKLAVADMLAVFVDAVYGDLAAYSGLSLSLAAVLYMLQLYFDFSGYTDIALGTAGILGITLPQNFKNPYFATNFSGFWARWHISLSSWLQDYIFTPLVWSRWTEKLPLIGRLVKKPPVLSSIVVVFLVSGLWHGDALCYLAWGALMALYRVGEELFHRFLGKPQKKPKPLLRVGKTAGVLLLWCASLVFFRVGVPRVVQDVITTGTVTEALAVFPRMFAGISPGETFAQILAAYGAAFSSVPLVLYSFLGFTILCTAVALWADWYQCFRLKSKSLVPALSSLPTAPKWLAYYFLVLCGFAGFIASGGAGFLYGGF